MGSYGKAEPDSNWHRQTQGGVGTKPGRQEPGYLGSPKGHASSLEEWRRQRSDAVGRRLHVLLWLPQSREALAPDGEGFYQTAHLSFDDVRVDNREKSRVVFVHIK